MMVQLYTISLMKHKTQHFYVLLEHLSLTCGDVLQHTENAYFHFFCPSWDTTK